MSGFGDRRVVVTGLGVVTSLGHDTRRVFDALCAGTSGIRPIRRFDVSHFPAKIGGVIDDLEPDAIIADRPGRRLLRMSDWIQTLGLCATELGFHDAALAPGVVTAERLGVHFGVGRGGARVTETILSLLVEASREMESLQFASPEDARARAIAGAYGVFADVKPTDYLQQCPSLLSAYVAMRHAARGPMLTNVNLCSAGAQAIGEAAWAIARDDADVMLAGGADSMLNPAELAGFCALDAVSRRNEDGPEASKPFDLRRDGCVIAEGAAVVVLEELGHARKRGARIYAELLGYGASSDGHSVTAPPEDGNGAVRAIRSALTHAGLDPGAVDHVNAHGTATVLNDRIETAALKTVLGAHAYRIPVVSTKSMTGHPIAAAGALEAVISVMSLVEKRIPPTRNLRVRDPDCDLDYVAEGARSLPELHTVLSNSFAIGGSNACLVFAERP